MLTKLSDYFCSCLNPQRVRNKYTHETVVAKCGHCDACDKSRSDRYVSMINNMSKASKNTYFVTLTFAPQYMPVADLQLDNGSVRGTITHHRLKTKVSRKTKEHFLVDEVSQTSFSDDDVFKFDLADYHFFNLGMPIASKGAFLGKGRFGILDYSYAQRFIKRLRKLISYALPTVDIKVFVVGEYGSRTFRPHFHFIIFTSDTVYYTQFKNFIALAWKYGRYDVQLVQSSAASYVASYCASSSSLPKFLQTKSIKPFCHHSCFKAYTFSREDTKKRLQELYRDDSPYTLQETSSGLDLFPLSSSLRLFAYPKPPRFRELADYEVFSILQQYERNAIAQRTLNPRFKVQISVPTFCEPSQIVSGDMPEDVIEDAWLTLSEIHDAYKRSLDSTKKCNFVLVNKNDYGKIYASYRAFTIANIMGCSSYDIAMHVICFYRGSSSHVLNFELSLLNYQYSSLELCDSEQDVMYLYSYFNENTSSSALLSAGYSADANLSDAISRFKTVVANSHLREIKHKDRNSYNQYIIHHG